MPKVKTSKEEVLEKLIPVLRKNGIANSSMSDLAKACDIQKSHFYYYFENKEMLVKEVLQVVNSYFSYNTKKILSASDHSLSQKIEALEKLILKLFTGGEGGCLMANTALESAHMQPSYFEEVRSFFASFIDGVSTLLKENPTIDDSDELAKQLVQDIEGGILLSRVYQDNSYLLNATQRMKNTLLTK